MIKTRISDILNEMKLLKDKKAITTLPFLYSEYTEIKPFCVKLFRKTLESIEKEKGKVKMEWYSGKHEPEDNTYCWVIDSNRLYSVSFYDESTQSFIIPGDETISLKRDHIKAWTYDEFPGYPEESEIKD